MIWVNLTPNKAKESTTAFDGFPCTAQIQSKKKSFKLYERVNVLLSVDV